MHSPLKRTRPKPPPLHLLDLLREAFGAGIIERDLAGQFLSCDRYDEALSVELIRTARQSSERWELRQFCALLLQWQFLRIPAGDLDRLDSLLVRIGLKARRGLASPLRERVLEEGFTTRELKGFAREWRRFLGRQKRLFAGIRGHRTQPAVLHDLILASKRPTKVSLGRYLIEPAEVVERILDDLRVTRGVRAPYVETSHSISKESKHARRLLPAYEREILERLHQVDGVFWVTDDTSSEINSLVEHPLGTVVLVVKPPGSHHEFEIKRAGKRGSRPLDVVFEREGAAVPPSHRLDGGSIIWCLHFEAEAAARLCRIFRLVHGVDLQSARTHHVQSIYAVPTPEGEISLLDYLMTPSAYDGDFESMREALEKSAKIGMHPNRPGVPDLPGELGTCHNFLIKYWPGQAIQTGNSSFRIDLLERYLSDDGPREYFTKGLGRDFTLHEEQAFSEALLEEVLGSFLRPGVAFKNHARFIKTAFKLPENRRAADRSFLSLLDQVGSFWGTLMAMRGYSRGESFVARNVGLRSVWQDGKWAVKMIFMDHDDLHLPDDSTNNFMPLNILDGQCTDQNYVVGISKGRAQDTLFERLARIYRVDRKARGDGWRRLHSAKQRAYLKTQRRFQECEGLRKMFAPMFVDRIRDWDRAMRTHTRALAQGRDPKDAVTRQLKRRAYGENIITHTLEALERYDESWARLWGADPPV